MHIVTDADVPAYRRAVIASQERLRPWNPVNPGDLVYHLRMQSASHRTFLIRATDPIGDHDVVGKVNVTNIVRARAFSASMGYDSYDPYAGTGLFAEGLRLVVDVALAAEPDGLGLYRVEASTQPANTRSAGLLRRLGFRPRGDWPEYLWLSDGQGREAWRDHITYGITRSQWPAPTYAPRVPARPVLVLRVPAAHVHDPEVLGQAHAAAIELAVPVVRDSGAATCLRERLFDAVSGAVVVSSRAAQELVSELVAVGIESPVIASGQAIHGARGVVRLALQARAAAGVDDG